MSICDYDSFVATVGEPCLVYVGVQAGHVAVQSFLAWMNSDSSWMTLGADIKPKEACTPPSRSPSSSSLSPLSEQMKLERAMDMDPWSWSSVFVVWSKGCHRLLWWTINLVRRCDLDTRDMRGLFMMQLVYSVNACCDFINNFVFCLIVLLWWNHVWLLLWCLILVLGLNVPWPVLLMLKMKVFYLQRISICQSNLWNGGSETLRASLARVFMSERK